jgi:hypothetical protein
MKTYYCPNNHGALPLPMDYIGSNGYCNVYQCPACLHKRTESYNCFGNLNIVDTPYDASDNQNDAPTLCQAVVGLALLALFSGK